MAESKYGNYIITELKQGSRAPAPGQDSTPPGNPLSHTPLLNLDGHIIEDAFYVECVWIWPGDFYPETAEPRKHAHDYDEVVTFFGTDPDNPNDLCGEIEFWLEDERHILTKSSLIFVPKGLHHCPLVIRRVDRPIFHFAAGTGGAYTQE